MPPARRQAAPSPEPDRPLHGGAGFACDGRRPQAAAYGDRSGLRLRRAEAAGRRIRRQERASPAPGGGRRPQHTATCGRARIGAMVPSLAVQAGEGLRPMSQSIVHAAPEAERKALPGPLRLSPLWLLFAALALAVPVAPLLLAQRAPELP